MRESLRPQRCWAFACFVVATTLAAGGIPRRASAACYAPQCYSCVLIGPGEYDLVPKPNGATCNDGNSLTLNDVCTNAVCAGTLPPFSVAAFNSLEKIEKNQAITTSSAGAVLSAAQNEFEAFQVAIRPPSGFGQINVRADPLLGPSGSSLPLAIFREEFINVGFASGPDGAPGSWPDRLIPQVDEMNATSNGTGFPNSGAFPYPSTGTGDGSNLIAYLEVYVPKTAPAGTYRGWVNIDWNDGGGAHTVSLPITLTVYPFQLPSTSSLQSYYTISSDAACAPDGFVVGAQDGLCVDLVKKYAWYALDHRISVDPTTVPLPAGTSFVTAFADYLNGTNVPAWRTTNLPVGHLADAVPSTAGAFPHSGVSPNFASAAAWYNTYYANQWLSRAFWYLFDEPRPTDFGVIATRADAAHAFAPPARALVTTSAENAATSLSGYVSRIDLMTPNVTQIQRPIQAALPDLNAPNKYGPYRPPWSLHSNRQFWWYQACDSAGVVCSNTGDPNQDFRGYPEYAIDVTGVKNRAMQWMSFGFGMVSELYWETVAALTPTTPAVIDGNLNFGGKGLWGDGTLCYPGHNRPLPSVRLKTIRDGMEDYEYLRLVADPNCAATIANHLFAHAKSARGSVTSQTLLDHRAAAASKIMNPASACPYTTNPVVCAVGWGYCGSTCVNLDTDANCGYCGNHCAVDEFCRAGACVPRSCNPPCP